jgi:uncharacterized membrane protein YphA (DoxX/SURF4 family)
MTTVNNSISKSLATAIPSLYIIESGIAKLAGVAPMVQEIQKAGMGQFAIAAGIAEIILGIVFMLRKTLRLALIGLSCYFSGAIAIQFSHGGNGIFPLIILLLIWVSALVRDKYFFSVQVKRDNRLYGPGIDEY